MNSNRESIFIKCLNDNWIKNLVFHSCADKVPWIGSKSLNSIGNKNITQEHWLLESGD